MPSKLRSSPDFRRDCRNIVHIALTLLHTTDCFDDPEDDASSGLLSITLARRSFELANVSLALKSIECEPGKNEEAGEILVDHHSAACNARIIMRSSSVLVSQCLEAVRSQHLFHPGAPCFHGCVGCSL